MTKVCSSCDIEKDHTEFYKKTKTSYRSSCKVCHNKITKDWVQNNPVRRKEIVNRSYLLNSEAKLEKAKSYREQNIERALWHSAKNRAQKYGLAFSISPEDIQVPDKCPVFKFPLVVNSGKHGGSFNSPSLDKINPLLGYVKGNVQVISSLANTMKNNASKEELIMFAKWILNGEE